MKVNLKTMSLLLLAAGVTLVTPSCKKKEGCTDSTATNFDSNAEKDNGSCTYEEEETPPPGGAIIEVKDSIVGSVTWTANNIYIIKGWVYGVSGSSLTIEAGTLIKGDKDTKSALIMEPGSTINALGTAAKPIVFTSNQPAGSKSYGDWGGIILCGKAPVNTISGSVLPILEGGPRTRYGGTDAADNSGTMQYVRIEFAGIAFSPDNEVNGLTFAGVGSGTTIDHIMVTYCGDDSYEFFGGTVNCKYLVAHRGWDDDFDTDNGYSGHVQFGVSQRDPYAADASGSKGFESDNDGSGSGNTPKTMAVFSNMTIVGGLVSPSSTAYSTNFVAGAHIRRNSSQSIFNTVIMGHPCGVLIDDKPAGSTSGNIANNTLKIKNTIIAGIPANKSIMYVINGASSLTSTSTMGDTIGSSSAWGAAVGPLSWLWNSANSNKKYTNSDDVRLQNPFNLTNPNFVPTSSSPLVDSKVGSTWTGIPVISADFTDSKLTDSFFDQVGYIGAFAGTQTSSDNWLSGWTDFDAVNTSH